MDKKKMAGIILFTILIVGILIYPNIKEAVLKHRVNAMLVSGEVENAYKLLTKRQIEENDWAQSALLQAKAKLGYDITDRIKGLIDENRLSPLQELLDTNDEALKPYLIKLSKVEGLVLSEKQHSKLRYLMAMEEIKPYGHWPDSNDYKSSLEKAMEIRGETDVVDNIYIRYLLNKGELELAIELYEEIPEKYIDDVHWIFQHELGQQTYRYDSTGMPVFLTEEEIIDNISYLETLELPSELMRLLSLELTIYSRAELPDTGELDFFKDNIYFDYYKLISEIMAFQSDTQLVLNNIEELKNRQEFKAMKDRDELLDVLENSQMVAGFMDVSKEGVLLCHIWQGKTITYDTVNGQTEELPLSDFQILETSPGRDFHLVRKHLSNENSKGELTFEFQFYILDKNFGVVHDLGIYNSSFSERYGWIDERNLVFADQVIDCITGEILDYQGRIQGMDLGGPGLYELYLIDENHYAAIEYTNSWEINQQIKEYTHYKERDINTHEVLLSIPLKQFDGLLGACDNYLYVGKVIDDIIFVVEAINKETMERENLPFYSIHFNQYPNMEYLNY